MKKRNDGKWLTVEEVAEIQRVDPETVRRWIRTKKLPATKQYGRRWLIFSLDIDIYKKTKLQITTKEK